METFFPDSKTEHCVMCHKDTGIPKDLHVDDPRRLGCRVEEMGQMCPDCFRKTHTPRSFAAEIDLSLLAERLKSRTKRG